MTLTSMGNAYVVSETSTSVPGLSTLRTWLILTLFISIVRL